MNIHLTFAVTALTVVLIILAKELIHPMAAVVLAMCGVLYSGKKLKIFAGE